MTGFQKLGGALELCSGESQRPDEAHNGLTGRLIVVDNRNQQVRRHPHAFHCLGCWLRCGLPVTLTQESPALRKGRSEEHTSELQSLMSNSYAVFCLQKKKT